MSPSGLAAWSWRFEHGRPPKADDVVGEALDITQVTLVRTERAIVVVDTAARRLSVHAGHAAIKELLRRLVGAHLFGNEAHFRKGGLYTLAPLANGLDDALASSDVPGLRAVTLVSITLTTSDERITREAIERVDLRKSRRARELYDALAEGATVEWCKLRLELEGHKQPVVVELAASRKKVPRAKADVERVLDEWLLARGFLVLPEHLRPQPRATETG